MVVEVESVCNRIVVEKNSESIIVQWGRGHHKIKCRNDKQESWIEWGCLQRESIGLPIGPSVHLNDLMGGYLDAFFPRFVFLCIESFWVERRHRVGAWYHVHPQNVIQGVVLSLGLERLYIVMMEPNRRLTDVQSWPVVLQKNEFHKR